MPQRKRSQLAAALGPDFEILRVLGEGTMAHVYLAREVELERLVAIKVLKAEVSEDETARKRFIREARSAAKISHRNVTAVYRVGALDDEVPFIVMEYVEGRNLADALAAEGPFEEEATRAILAQLASALAAAHAVGIIHRDVRPANVIREKGSGRVVLTDFGIAGMLESGRADVTRLTKVGQLLGRPRYMSPEQLMGESLTDQTDIFSLGVLGHELLTVDGPYRATSPVDMATAHLNQDPRPVTDFRPDIDPALSDLLQRCLARKPEHRPGAAELERALERLGREPAGGAAPGADAAAGAGPRPHSPAEDAPALQSFLKELGRRHVYQVTAWYAGITLATIEVGPSLLQRLRFPAGAADVLIALVLAAFPVVLALAWAYDITRHGVVRTAPAEMAGSGRKTRLLQATGLTLSLVIALVLGWWILGS